MAEREVDAREELEQIARHARTRIAELNLIHPGAGRPFDQVCRFTRDGLKIEWSTNGELFLIDVRISSGLAFSAGSPDRRLVTVSRPMGRIGGVEVFESGDFSPAAWLDDPAHAALLAGLELRVGEQLLVARNDASLTARPSGFDEDWNRLGRLITLVRELPPDEPVTGSGEVLDGLTFDRAALPGTLRSLAPTVRKWAVADDDERSELIESANDNALRDLWLAVRPQLDAIDEFINAHEEPLPDEALLLGSLAQAAHEARLELERRSKAPA